MINNLKNKEAKILIFGNICLIIGLILSSIGITHNIASAAEITKQNSTESICTCNCECCRKQIETISTSTIQTTAKEKETTTIAHETTVTSTTSNKTKTTTSTTETKVLEIEIVKKSNEEIAEEVIQGLWGNGEERKIKLTENGYIYRDVQDIVNELVKSQVINKTIDTETSYPVTSLTDSDYVLLCNCVAHEAGSDWISTYNKALVVEVVMNRVNSSSYPNTIYGVITQKGQFSGSSSYANLSTYSSKVTQDVKDAVTYYFNHLEEFTQGYTSFYGDGKQNHFS